MPTVRVNGVGLYYEDRGEGLPVVFAHGGGGDRNQWAFQVPHFAKRYRVVTFDNRGHGRSEVPEGPYSVEIFSADLLGLLDALSLEAVVLVGLTMGAMTGLRFALDHPERLRGLVLVGASEGGRPEMRERFEMSASLAESQGMKMLAEGFCSVVFSPWFQQERADFVARCKTSMQAASPEGYARSIRALAERPPLRGRLGEIRTKTLVVVGADDVTGFPLEDAALYAREIPDARRVTLEKAGHLACIEQPEAFNRLLDAFLEEIGESGDLRGSGGESRQGRGTRERS